MVTKESADDNEYERQRLLNIEKNKKLLKFVPHIHPTDRKGTLVSQASISVLNPRNELRQAKPPHPRKKSNVSLQKLRSDRVGLPHVSLALLRIVKLPINDMKRKQLPKRN
jgi:hypothetical protein